ncbi:hypothetical protein BJ742DRAFT_218841 [Cladochytrium replicatum]|nr:hypothetical protein BJ742DRAFT_218841 [Cladochytrium replicatum]
MAEPKKVPVAILGATGTVGQRFITLLANHPNFVIAALGASARSSGKTYVEATKWKQTQPIPDSVLAMIVHPCEPEHFSHCRVIFSGLDSDVAGDIEAAFLKADFAGIFSNAKNYRMHDDVPLVVPVVNPDHLDVIPAQRKRRGISRGFLVTNANCSTTGLVVPLKALQDKFGHLSKVFVVTLQAISGAGYPGVPSLDIFDNVVPYISGEEEKMEIEASKILGTINSNAFADANTSFFVDAPEMKVSAQCNRVAVLDGHTECVSLEFARRPAPSLEQIREALSEFSTVSQKLACYSAPPQAIIVRNEADRPQPRLDREAGKGQSVTVGRIRDCSLLDVKFVLLSHNTVLGAAGSSVLNAEIALAKGYIPN